MHINKATIEEAMNKNGILSQQELASKIGITKQQLTVMLSEKYSPIKAKALFLCEILKITPTSLFNDPISAIRQVVQDELLPVKKSAVSAIELFAGAGGLALGLEKAKIKTFALIESEKYPCETLRKNRPKWNVINDDIANIDFKRYKNKIDVITGGFPCQSFSYAGKNAGFDDMRGKLFYEFVRCITEVQPLMFMAENVRGLLSHDKGRTFDIVLQVFKNIGYNVTYEVLNAVDYDVPQKRERIIIIGTKDNVNFKFPKKSHFLKTIKDVLKDVPLSEGQLYSKNKKYILDLIPSGGCWRDLPLDLQKKYLGNCYYTSGGKNGIARRLAWDEPSPTLTCSPRQKRTERCHPDETRPLTVREYARIQTFPDDWDFCGGIGEKYKQIGNALPVELGYKLAIQIKKAVLDYKKSFS